MFRKVASEPFGIGLYLLASQFDHSCSPNSTVVFQGRELRVMAERDLEAGESPMGIALKHGVIHEEAATLVPPAIVETPTRPAFTRGKPKYPRSQAGASMQ